MVVRFNTCSQRIIFPGIWTLSKACAAFNDPTPFPLDSVAVASHSPARETSAAGTSLATAST